MRSLLFAFLLITLACGDDAEQPCVTRSDCPFLQVCVNGACMEAREDAGEEDATVVPMRDASDEPMADARPDTSGDAAENASADAAEDAPDVGSDSACVSDADCRSRGTPFCSAGSCVECMTAEDCPPVERASGVCEYARECGESGSQEWIVTARACTGNSCVALGDSLETRSCTRETDGMVCTGRCSSTWGCSCMDETCSPNRRISLNSSGDDSSLRHSVTCAATGETCFREGTGVVRSCALECPEGSALTGCCSSGSEGCGGTSAPSMSPTVNYSFGSGALCATRASVVTCTSTVSDDVTVTCRSFASEREPLR